MHRQSTVDVQLLDRSDGERQFVEARSPASAEEVEALSLIIVVVVDIGKVGSRAEARVVESELVWQPMKKR
jgi:hypothetical protein